MSQSLSPEQSRVLHAQDDKLVFKVHNDKMNSSRNAKVFCQFCGTKPQKDGEDDTQLKVCSRCRMIRYCSSDCQKKDWKRHKKLCQIHQDTQAQLGEVAVTTIPDHSGTPSASVTRYMLEDFVNLHTRMLSVVIGHELAQTNGGTVPPIDVRQQCVAFILELRDSDASPASVFKFVHASIPLAMTTFAGDTRRKLETYAEGLVDINLKTASMGLSVIPALFRVVSEPPIVYLTNVEIMRNHLDPNLLVRTIPANELTWKQLEYNAERGLVSRRHWNDRLKTWIEWLGTMKQKDDAWRWEKLEDSRGNRKTADILRERRKQSGK